ncbi:MAG: 2TM domain-containing protein [Hyphomicrobium sp.]
MLGDTGFFFHFSAYVLVNAILIVINLLTTPNHLWFFWPLLGWESAFSPTAWPSTSSQGEAVRRRARTRGTHSA